MGYYFRYYNYSADSSNIQRSVWWLMHAPYQVGLSIDGSQLISEHVASAVSRAVGGNGEVDLIDSWDTYKLWMIDLTEPFNGKVKIIDENGYTRTVDVETPMP